MKKNCKTLRDDFPILHKGFDGKKLVYFDNASTTQKPYQVLDAVMNFYTESNANILRGVHAFAEKATALYEGVRVRVAHFINARPEEIIFTSGTTSSINAVVSMWGDRHIMPGDEIVITELEHHANLLPWQRLARKKNALLKCIPVFNDGTLDISYLDTIITKKTKIVAVTAVSNAIGTHVDLTTIIAHAKNVGARILIDAAQLVPHAAIDVAKLECDFLAFSGHKLCAPTGVGVLFIKKELHDDIDPYEVGGGMVAHTNFICSSSGPQEDPGLSVWVSAPQKFEAGTPPIAQVIGLGAAIDYVCDTIDFAELQKHEAHLCARLINGLTHIKRVSILGPQHELAYKGHLVSFTVNGIHAHDVAAFLDTKGIAVRAGHHCAQPLAQKLGYEASIRVSFYAYNTAEEVDMALRIIDELVHFL